jgi:hypothetical protein
LCTWRSLLDVKRESHSEEIKIKLGFYLTDDEAKYARVLVPCKPFQPGSIFVGKARRPP